MTAPRSHSQAGSGPPRGFAPRLPISIAFTWPPTVFGPHSSQPVAEPDPPCPPPPKSGPRVKCPARRDLGGQALPPFTVPAVRPPRAPRLCGSLESRRVRGRSLGSCKVSRGRSLAQTSRLLGDGGPTCTHSTDGRTKPKPSSRGLQNFPPPTPRAACIPTTFRCGARSGRASPGARPPCGVRSPQAGGSPGTSESARAALPRRRRRGSSPQPARWPAGTHLKEGETEAQRGPATSARSHCTAASSGAGGWGTPRPRGILTAGLAHELPHLLGGGVGSAHGARDYGAGARVPRRPWAGAGCVAAGPASGPARAGRRDRSEPRVPRGAEARPLIAAEGGAPRS